MVQSYICILGFGSFTKWISNGYIYLRGSCLSVKKGSENFLHRLGIMSKHVKYLMYMKFDLVYEHLIIKEFDPSYSIRVFHGEKYIPEFQGEGNSGRVQGEDEENREAYKLYRDVFVLEEEVGHAMSETRDYDFSDLLGDAETLFPGCTTYTKLSAVC